MVKYLLGIISGIILVVLFVVFLVLAGVAVQSFEPGIEADSVLTIRLSGRIPEHIDGFSIQMLRTGPPPTVLELRNVFEKAAEDDRIRALTLHLGGLGAGWAKAQEIRWGIEKFKQAGKPVFAFLTTGSTIDYLVASAADEVYMSPEGMLDVKGLRIEASFYTETLAKLGIEAELHRVGKYKSAVEPYVRTSMSDEYREVWNSILDDVYSRFLTTVGVARGKSEEEMRQIVETGPFLPRQALDAELIDGLKYRDELEDHIKETLELDELRQVKYSEYRNTLPDSLGFGAENQVAVVYAVGEILSGAGQTDPFTGLTILGSDSFSATLRKLREDDDIKAVILRINSPGGDAVASDQIWREVNLLRDEKPLVVSFSDVAASGGYYIAMAGAPVLAYPGTYTGSIGVFYGKINLRGLYEKIGLKKEVIKRGRFADIYSDYRSLNDDERAKLRGDIEIFYKGFVDKVAESREREWEEIDEVAQGRVWMGSQAEQQGLVDELGGFDRAIELVREAAGIEADEEIQLVPYPAPKNPFEALFDADTWVNEPAWVSVVRSRLAGLPLGPSLLQGGMLRITPYSIQVR